MITRMTGDLLPRILLVALAGIELFNGLQLALRARKVVSIDDSSGVGHGLIQEFGLYSLGLAAAYLATALHPIHLAGVLLVAMAVNVGPAIMHGLRAAGVFFGGVTSGAGRGPELQAGLLHATSVVLVFACWTGAT